MKRTHHRITLTAAAGLLALSLGAAAQGTASSSGGSYGSSGSSSTMGTGAGSSAGTAGATQGGTGTRNTPQNESKLARADRRFIEEAASSGMFELQAAQLATTKATDPAVKEFASMLVDHHTKANSELMSLASTLGLELPPAPKRSMRNEVEKMGKMTGAEFDREFVKEVGIDAHEKNVKDFQKASKDVKEPQLKAWVDKTLPTLQAHLAAAQKLPQAGSDRAKSAQGTSGTGSSSMGAGGSGSGSMGTTR